ncbi:BON domain-containing protein [Pseudidiomarina aestuarii]|uniref:BON domain-containing protein n=1 Tax=Pseudidiomarina aestuarii TaxID=624146 RepID=UPI003A96B65C
MQIFKVISLATVVTLSSLALAGCSEEDSQRVQDTTSDAAEKMEEAGKAAAEYARGTVDEAGDYLSDAAITARIKTALAEAEQVSAMDINVETINGNVVLSGVVATDAERDLAEQLAEGIEGVESVSNDIEVRN